LPAKTSKIAGPWNDEYTPFIRRMMNLLERPPVSVWVSACTQGVKTTLVQILLAYICAVDPGPTGIVMPQEGDVKKRIRTKLRPLFESNPILYEKIGRDVRNLNVGEETDLGDMLLFLIWSTSLSKMADAAIQNMIYDEVGKFIIAVQTGENPIELCRNRQRTYESIKRELGVSSPQRAGDLFDMEMRSGTDEQWFVPCMLCGKWHKLLTWVDPAGKQYIVIDKKGDDYFLPDEYKSGKRSRYVCPNCKQAWSEADRWRSNCAGKWVTAGREMDENGKITGEAPPVEKYSFNVHAMMLYPEFAGIGQLAKMYVEAMADKQRGRIEKLKNWQLNQRNIPWKEEMKVVDVHKLEDKKTDRKSGVVPITAKLLTAGADFHKDSMGNVRVDYVIKAWSNDLKDDDILFGHAMSLDEMFRITTSQSFPWAEPTDRPELMLSCGFVDSGYQPNDPTEDIIDEVYQFCRKYWRMKIWFPIRGGKPNQVELFKPAKLDEVVERSHQFYRRRTARQYRGMVLYTLAVYQFKNKVMESAEAPLGVAGSTSYPADFPAEFFEQLTNEYKGKNDKGHWGWWVKEPHLASHALDVSVYARAAGHFKGIDKMWSEAELQKIESAMAERNIGNTRPVRRIGRVQRFE
jgi:phage terminase large subunit GpA-like protein